MPVFHIGARPAGMNRILLVNPQQQVGTKKSDEGGSLELVEWVLDEQRDLLRRFAAAPAYVGAALIPEIGRIDLANPVVAEAGAVANGAGAGFMTNHAQGQLEAAALCRVSVV